MKITKVEPMLLDRFLYVRVSTLTRASPASVN